MKFEELSTNVKRHLAEVGITTKVEFYDGLHDGALNSIQFREMTTDELIEVVEFYAPILVGEQSLPPIINIR